MTGLKKIINGSIRLDDLVLNVDENQNPLPWSFYMQQELFIGSFGLKDFLIKFPGVSAKQYHFLQKGTLSMGTQKGEYPLLVMSLKNAGECLGMADSVNTIEIRLKRAYYAEELSKDIKLLLGEGFEVDNWIQQSRASFALLRLIKIMLLSIIFSISIVAAIGMASTLTLTVMQNRSKIAILKSMGIKDSAIFKIFLINTGLTGLIGVLLGTAFGYVAGNLLVHNWSDVLIELGIKRPQVYISMLEVTLIGLSVITLYIVAAIIPAKQAINTDVTTCLQEQ
ncbi:MAG: ABC transporter permease [bacterium]|nr:ABC transporter permease [bacterium]